MSSTEQNHQLVVEFDDHVPHYIEEHGAILGRFQEKPINLCISPFVTRDKPDFEWHFTLTDLDSYNLFNYPSFDDIVHYVILLWPSLLIYKVEICHAFRRFKLTLGICICQGLNLMLTILSNQSLLEIYIVFYYFEPI